MAIPELTKESIVQALKFIDENGIKKRQNAKKYALVVGNKKYPPKYVIAVARHLQDDVEINTERYEPDDCLMSQFGSVNVQGKEIIVSDPKLFLDALRLCHDFNIEAHLDGTLKLSFSLNGLTHRILEEPDEY